MSDLEQRIERLEAVEGVRELLQRYASAVDRLPPIEELADLFTEDAVLINPDRHEGRQAILDYYAGVLGSLDWSRHHIVNSTFEVEATDRARHRGCFLALMSRGGELLVAYGDYEDVMLRGDDGNWQFQEKGNHVAGVTTLATSTASRE